MILFLICKFVFYLGVNEENNFKLKKEKIKEKKSDIVEKVKNIGILVIN